MTPGMIADSIVNLCGAIGLGVAMATLYRRDPRSPLTRRLLVALGIIALLFLVRGTAWWSGSGVLDNLSMIPAALIPLGALIVTEGILRRHAPRPAKIVILTGGIALGLAGAVGSERFAAPLPSCSPCSSFGGFAICAWLLAMRDRTTLMASENRSIGRLAVGAVLVIPFIVTDFRVLMPDIPVRLGALGALLVVTAILIAERGAETQRQALADDGAAAIEFGASRYRRGIRRAGCRCGAGHAVLRHRDRGRSHHRLDGGRAARALRVAGARCSQFRRDVAGAERAMR